MNSVSACLGFSWAVSQLYKVNNGNNNLVHLLEMSTGYQVILHVCSDQYALSFSSSVARCSDTLVGHVWVSSRTKVGVCPVCSVG